MLAAIQAELLRILLFGHKTSEGTMQIPRDMVAENSGSEDAKKQPALTLPSPNEMQQALALAMGVILARAAVMPSAMDDANNESDNAATTKAVKIALPNMDYWQAEDTVKLGWKHFDPWSPSGGSGDTSSAQHLMCWSIPLPNDDSIASDNDPSTAKRQKRSDSTGGDDDDGSNMADETFHAIVKLAHAIAQFLLETNAIQWFQRPGGVLLFVLSLALSRGVARLKSEMDDTDSRLTSQFGHCSQELLNLLLTGQAGAYRCIL